MGRVEFAKQRARRLVVVYLHYLDVVICPLFLDHFLSVAVPASD